MPNEMIDENRAVFSIIRYKNVEVTKNIDIKTNRLMDGRYNCIYKNGIGNKKEKKALIKTFFLDIVKLSSFENK